MADQKISQLTDGTSFQAGDEAVVNRSGTNYKVDPTQFGSSIDVTGTVTADGLTVNSNGTFTNTSGVTLNLERDDTFLLDGNFISGLRFGNNDSSGAPPHGTGIKVTANGTFGAMFLDILSGSRDAWENNTKAIRIDEFGDISFYEDTGTTPKFFWDASAERLGIGTTSPSGKLHISGTGTTYFFADGTQTSDGEIFDLVVRNGTDTVTSIKSIRTGTDDAAALTFSTQPTFGGINERMRITSTGNVGIGTSSPGQKLEVNGNIIADGIYLGGTAAANLLEDYEEGTWTPEYAPETGAFTSVTYQDQGGSYTKIGNRVFFQGRIRTSSITVGTASGDVRISGLPFTSINNSATGRNAGSISACVGFGGDMPSGLDVEPNATFFNLRYRTSANGATNDLDVSDLSTGSNSNTLFFSGSYIV